MEYSKIEWTTHTFNPWVGCEKVSQACKNCYAEAWAKRTGQADLWQGERRRTSAANWKQPLRWNREAATTGERPRVFCASLADVFEDRYELVEWRQELFALIRATPHLDWLLLTKRPENVRNVLDIELRTLFQNYDWQVNWLNGQPPANVWLGTTVENQEQADKRIPELLKIPATVRFLSCEPLLGPVELNFEGRWCDRTESAHDCDTLAGKLHWVIVGGESGPAARPSHPDWFRSLRDQCHTAGVAFHFKQHGEWLHESQTDKNLWESHCKKTGEVEEVGKHVEFGGYTYKVGKARAGRLLDGRTYDELPQGAAA